VGFSGKQVFLFRSIELLVTAGIYPRKKTILVMLMVLDRPSGYNAILGRTALNELKVKTLTPHLSMKFPINEGIEGPKRRSKDGPGMLEQKLEKAFEGH
jgi:hypothetical protein